MPSPGQDLLDTSRRLREGAAGLQVRPDEQAAVGTSAALLRKVPTATVSPYAPGTAPKPGAPGQVIDLKPPAPGRVRQAVRAVTGAPGNAVNATMRTLRSPATLGAGGTALAAVPEALRTGEVLTNPNATWNDVGTQAAEGVGRIASAGAGAAGGAALGAGFGSVVPGVGNLVGGALGGIAGGLYGYWAGDRAIRGLRTKVGADPRSPAEKLGAPVAPTRVQEMTGERPTIATGPAPAAPLPALATEAPYSNEGRNYPNRSSAKALRTPDLTGKIVRDGNSYSGTDVKFGVDIVTPDGALVNGGDPNKPKGFGVTSLDTSAGYQSDLRELGRLRAERAEREAGFAANQPGGGLTGMSTRSLVDDLVARNKPGQMEQELRGMSPRQRAETLRTMATLDQRGAEAQMSNAAALRGQDISAATSRYGVDAGSTTARRGQDMDYAEKIDARRLDLAAKEASRARIAAIAQAAGGDMDRAVALAVQNGVDPANFKTAADNDRTVSQAGRTRAQQYLQGASTVPGKDGVPVVSEGLLAQNMTAAVNAVPGFLDAGPADQLAQAPQANAAIKLVAGANRLRRDGILESIGLDSPKPAMTTLPSEERLRGARMERLGFSGYFPGKAATKGDYQVTYADGTRGFFPGDIGQEELGLLEQRGVKVKKD